MSGYKRNFSVWFLAFGLCLCSAGCTEEIMDAVSAASLFKIIHTGHNYGKDIPNATGNLTQLLSLAKNQDNTYTYYDAGGIFDNKNNAYGVLNKTVIGQDGSLVLFKTMKRQQELIGETGAPVIDPTVLDPPLTGYKMAEINTTTFLEIVNWYDGNFANNKLVVGSNANIDVEVRFGPGKTQKAHRFISAPDVADIYDYATQMVFIDYVDVPFEVWDVTHTRQLMVSFRDMQADGKFNLIHLNPYGQPPNEVQSREYIAIVDMEYATTPSEQIKDPDFAFKNGYRFWPVLAAGAAWNPASLPESTVKITKLSNIDHYQFYPFPMLGEAMFSVNPNLDQVAVLSISGSTLTGPLKSLSIFDASLNAKGKAIQNNITGQFYGLKATSDGGAISCYSTVDFNEFKGKLTKIKNDLTVDFDVSFNLNELPGIFNFYGHLDWPILHFIEKDGGFFLFYYYANAGPDLIQIYQVNASGLAKIKTVQAPEIDQDNISGIQDIVAYGGGYALITVYGNVYFLDSSFNPLSNMISLPDLKEGLLYRSFHLYAVQDKVYFVGATPDNPEGDLCPDCSPYDEGQPPRLSIGTVDKKGNIRRKVLDLGGRIFQCRSVFNDDGSAAHIALVETSPRAREIIFFKTDGEFNVVK